MNSQRQLVSVGMPVFNGGATLEAAITSILNQSYRNLELVISDNASTDATSDICQHFVAIDRRVRYVRQSANLGAWANFMFLLEQSHGKYFMWAAADDTRTDGFIEACLEILENDPSVVFSSAPNYWSGEEDCKAQEFELRGNQFTRYRSFIRICWSSQACFYSVMRRDLVASFKDTDAEYFAVDWSVIVNMLSAGDFARCKHEKLILGRGGASQSADVMKMYSTRLIHSVFPLYDYSSHFFRLIMASAELNSIEKSRLFGLLTLFNLRILRKKLVKQVVALLPERVRS